MWYDEFGSCSAVSAFYVASGAGVRCPWRFGNLNNYGNAGLANANGNNGPGTAVWYGAPWIADILINALHDPCAS